MEVVALKERVGGRGAIVSADLPGLFSAFGIDVPEDPIENDLTAQTQAEDRAGARIRRFFDQPYIGPLSSAVFVANLLSRLGQERAAAAIRTALAAEAERWGDRAPKTAAGVFRTIATGRLAAGDFEDAARWQRREISFWQAVKEHLLLNTPPEALAEWQRNMAAGMDEPFSHPSSTREAR